MSHRTYYCSNPEERKEIREILISQGLLSLKGSCSYIILPTFSSKEQDICFITMPLSLFNPQYASSDHSFYLPFVNDDKSIRIIMRILESNKPFP
jgi:hypothetical protein